jgi:hypothetical protein
MLAALEWLEIESSKLNPQTQDIAPWMESSRVGTIPVPTIASSRPPAHASSIRPVGTVLSISTRPSKGSAPSPRGRSARSRYWVLIGLLLTLLGVLAFSGYWWQQQSGANQVAPGQGSALVTQNAK